MTKKPGLKARSKSIKAAMAAAKGVETESAEAENTPAAAPVPVAPGAAGIPLAKHDVNASALCPVGQGDGRILDERAEIYARPPKLKRGGLGRDAFVQVRLGSVDRYGIPFTHADEIMPSVEPTPVPGTPDFVAGVVNLRGTLLTVVDLGKFLGIKGAETESDARIVVVSGEGMRFGALVAGVDGSQPYDPENLNAPLGGGGQKDSAYVRGLYEGKVAVLDMAALFRAPMLKIDQSGR